MKLSGHTILITGGGSGIGLSLAGALLQKKNEVIICGRTLSRLEAAQKAQPGLHIAQCDVSDEAQVVALKARCEEEFGGITVLINNAAIYQQFVIGGDEFPLEKKMREVAINVQGPMRMVHHFLPMLLSKPEAAIVNVTSGLAFTPYTLAPIYCATKAGLHSWTLSLRNQLADTSVKVFELMPPLIDTEMTREVDGIPKMSTDVLTEHFLKGFGRDKYEIVPGISRIMRMMSRLTPNLTVKMMNR
ncbi:MAG TPA: SDR family NAD(P)-dependent oxidoreductase [Anaerolineae bacterium]|nr:SDR family NAD(P)-dependent oxidoreductase [Anaerolineae bacterium]